MCIIYMLKDIIYHYTISNLTMLEIMIVFFSRELIKYNTVRKHSGKKHFYMYGYELISEMYYLLGK